MIGAIITWAMGFETSGIRGSKPGSPEYEYQLRYAGPTEFHVRGGGEEIWADGIDLLHGYLIDTKYIANKKSSPYILGSIKETVQNMMIYRKRGIADEFRRYAAVTNDPATPVRGLKVITNVSQAAPLFQRLMKEYNVAGYVEVRP